MSMVKVVKGTVAEYPYSFAKLRQDNPDTSFPADPSPELLAEFGAHPVFLTERPTADIAKNIAEALPELVNGTWVQRWRQDDASPQEIAERQIAVKEAADRETVTADSFVGNFAGMTPAEVATYINANGTTVATLRTIVIKLAIMVLLLIRRELRR